MNHPDAYYPCPPQYQRVQTYHGGATLMLGPTHGLGDVARQAGPPDPSNPDEIDKPSTITIDSPAWLVEPLADFLGNLMKQVQEQQRRDPESLDAFTVLLLSSTSLGMVNVDSPGYNEDNPYQARCGTSTATRRTQGGKFEVEEYVKVMAARKNAMVYGCAQIVRRFAGDLNACRMDPETQAEGGRRFLAELVAAVRSKPDSAHLFPSLLELRLDGLADEDHEHPADDGAGPAPSDPTPP